MENKDILKEFLNINGIEVVEKKKSGDFHNPSEKHVENLIKFHRRVMESDNYFDLAIKNNSGKDVMNYNIWLRRALSLKEEINIKSDIFDEIIEQAKRSIEIVKNSNYISLMERANKRREIILGNCSVKNIYFKNNRLYIYDINKIEFNMVENDCIKYILKEKKKKKCINIKRIISLFLEGEGLGEDSFNYIYGIVNYPKESMRYISNNYINNLKEENVLINNLKDTTKIDYIGVI